MDLELSPRTAGFTLVEMVAVVAILSLLSVGSVLALRDTGASDVDPRTLTRALEEARREAVLSRRPMALLLSADGVQPQRYVGGDQEAWEDVTGRFTWHIPPAFETAAQSLRIVILPSGQTSPVRLRWSGLGQGRSRVCTIPAWESMTCRG